nr:hypothetical protein [Tanacetum cinerariifolium]
MYDDYMGGQPSDATRTAFAAPVTQNLQTQNASTTTTETALTPTNSSTKASAISNTSQDEELYVCQPDDFIDVDHLSHVYKLKKALSGLK